MASDLTPTCTSLVGDGWDKATALPIMIVPPPLLLKHTHQRPGRHDLGEPEASHLKKLPVLSLRPFHTPWQSHLGDVEELADGRIVAGWNYSFHDQEPP